MTLAPVAGLLSMTPAGRSVFFAGSRSPPWQLAPADARQLLTGYADSPAYEATMSLSRLAGPTMSSLRGSASPCGGTKCLGGRRVDGPI